jgi:hypothetical protein
MVEGKVLKNTENNNPKTDYNPFVKLIEVIRDDAEIKAKVKKLLQMGLYRRQTLLNSWLEQLRVYHASEDMLAALSCLFDDKIAAEVLALINHHKI